MVTAPDKGDDLIIILYFAKVTDDLNCADPISFFLASASI